MKLTVYIFSSVLVIMLVTGCKKDIDIFRPDHQDFDTTWVGQIPDEAPVNFLMKDLAPTVYTDSIDVSNSAEATLSSGVKCFFNEGSFVTAQNTAVTGSLTFTSKVFSKKGEVIQLGQSTETDKQLIDCSIISSVTFSKNDQPVFLKQGDSIDLHYAFPYNELLTSFYKSNSLWEKVVSPGSVVQPSTEGYQLRTANLPWVCIGKALDINAQDETYLRVKLPDNYTNANSIAYLVLKNKNTAVKLLQNVDSHCFYHPGIPKNEEGMILILSRQVHDYYLGAVVFSSFDKNETVINIKPVKKTLNDVMRILSAL